MTRCHRSDALRMHALLAGLFASATPKRDDLSDYHFGLIVDIVEAQRAWAGFHPGVGTGES